MIDKEKNKQTLDTIDYCIQRIRLALALDNPEIQGSFRAAYKMSEHLHTLIRVGAIAEEREAYPPIIMYFPKDDTCG